MNINNSNNNKIIKTKNGDVSVALRWTPPRTDLRRRERQRYIIGIEMRTSIYHTR